MRHSETKQETDPAKGHYGLIREEQITRKQIGFEHPDAEKHEQSGISAGPAGYAVFAANNFSQIPAKSGQWSGR